MTFSQVSSLLLPDSKPPAVTDRSCLSLSLLFLPPSSSSPSSSHCQPHQRTEPTMQFPRHVKMTDSLISHYLSFSPAPGKNRLDYNCHPFTVIHISQCIMLMLCPTALSAPVFLMHQLYTPYILLTSISPLSLPPFIYLCECIGASFVSTYIPCNHLPPWLHSRRRTTLSLSTSNHDPTYTHTMELKLGNSTEEG